VFNLDAVKETIAYCRERRRRYAIVLNGAPPKRDNAEAPVTATARKNLNQLKAPVWSGQITDRNTYSLSLANGDEARKYDPESQAASEIASLLSAVERFVQAIQGGTAAVNVVPLLGTVLMSQPAGC
jgi:chromosome partitioning protein